MSEKSYVSMEQRVCLVCGERYDTNSLLFDRRLKDSFERYTVTGYGLCPEHQKMNDDGYLALIECSNTHSGDTLSTQNADRTGRVAHIKREFAKSIFNIGHDEIDKSPVMYVQAGLGDKKGVLDVLEDMNRGA